MGEKISSLNVPIDSILIEIWLGNIRTSFIIKYDERWKSEMMDKIDKTGRKSVYDCE